MHRMITYGLHTRFIKQKRITVFFLLVRSLSFNIASPDASIFQNFGKVSPCISYFI
jgi:hypothetical protein